MKILNFKHNLLKLILRFLILILIIKIAIILPAKAQVLWLPDLKNASDWFSQTAKESNVSSCIRLDGKCLFKITAPRSEIDERVDLIEERLNQISQSYFRQKNSNFQIDIRTINDLPNLYVTVNAKSNYLMTVTSLDIQNEGISPIAKADSLAQLIRKGIQEAKQERQSSFLIQKGLITGGILGVILALNWKISRQLTRLKKSKNLVAEIKENQPVSTQLNRREQINIKEVQYRLLQLGQIGTSFVGSLIILGLFPYTRIGQVWLINLLRIPIRIGMVCLGTYLLIRLSYAAIAKFNAILVSNYLIDLESDRRLQLRINTISLVAKSIITLIWIGVGFIVGCSVIGVNITPLLAGLGILGVAVSLASQNLIRDAINGFFIIVEDQYAVGDVIQVGQFSGLVENINLRITQIRDSEGRLITIPNSEVKIVANLSSNWSRADLNIPIAYDTDVEKALILIEEVASRMSNDDVWREKILEEPQVLGIDNFAERGLIIRVWIKTQPLKQWDVSREFRRRIKIAFDDAGFPLLLPQQQVWLQQIRDD